MSVLSLQLNDHRLSQSGGISPRLILREEYRHALSMLDDLVGSVEHIEVSFVGRSSNLVEPWQRSALPE